MIDKLLYETRPGLWVSANLYRPADSAPLPTEPGAVPAAGAKNRPAIILCHSHHNPKTEGELQTMGMTWARQGALVLVPDHLGHGERRQHPFRTDTDYPRPFKRSRQDYYFRYDVALQLDLVGESLMGWLAWDLMRGLDVLLAQADIDPERTIILGAVAGGGDVAAVTAALDTRFAAAGVFNFGGPQPESRYPLPEDAEDRFGYAGSGSWESTRNLRRSASDGFLPWVIDGGIAPRRLIYAHEFSWDREHDPVWKRLEKIYAWYEVPDRLASAHGSGSVKGQPPESTHCNNIGSVHRRGIYAALARWFDMPAEVPEYSKTRPAAELQCWTDELREQLKPKLAREVAAEMGAEQIEQVRRQFDAESPPERSAKLAAHWARLLGNPGAGGGADVRRTPAEQAGSIRIERAVLNFKDDTRVPLVLLTPKSDKPVPVVIGVARQGKQRLLAARRELVARLLASGVAVCLADLSGTGETGPDDGGRDRTSHATSLSSSELMLGSTMLSAQLGDLSAVEQFLYDQQDIDADRIALWGDSLAEVNPPERQIVVPHAADDPPAQAEPLGGLIALFAALYYKDVRAVYVHRGLASYASAFDGPVVCLPHDAIVPGALTAGDLPPLAAQFAPRPLRLEGAVDAMNRTLAPAAIETAWAGVRSTYKAQDSNESLVLCEEDDAATAADWLVEQRPG